MAAALAWIGFLAAVGVILAARAMAEVRTSLGKPPAAAAAALAAKF